MVTMAADGVPRTILHRGPAGGWHPVGKEGNMQHEDEQKILPAVETVDHLPASTLAAFVGQLAALLARASARLHGLVGDQGDDVEAFTAEEVGRRLRCSVDLVRERGLEWGIALVLTRDCQGRPTRVVYPRASLRTYMANKPPGDGRSAA
jgi:hypothetical protein